MNKLEYSNIDDDIPYGYELYNCPFCNTKTTTDDLVEQNNSFWVACKNCSGQGPQKTSGEDAFAAWDRRPKEGKLLGIIVRAQSILNEEQSIS